MRKAVEQELDPDERESLSPRTWTSPLTRFHKGTRFFRHDIDSCLLLMIELSEEQRRRYHIKKGNDKQNLDKRD